MFFFIFVIAFVLEACLKQKRTRQTQTVNTICRTQQQKRKKKSRRQTRRDVKASRGASASVPGEKDQRLESEHLGRQANSSQDIQQAITWCRARPKCHQCRVLMCLLMVFQASRELLLCLCICPYVSLFFLVFLHACLSLCACRFMSLSV